VPDLRALPLLRATVGYAVADAVGGVSDYGRPVPIHRHARRHRLHAREHPLGIWGIAAVSSTVLWALHQAGSATAPPWGQQYLDGVESSPSISVMDTFNIGLIFDALRIVTIGGVGYGQPLTTSGGRVVDTPILTGFSFRMTFGSAAEVAWFLVRDESPADFSDSNLPFLVNFTTDAVGTMMVPPTGVPVEVTLPFSAALRETLRAWVTSRAQWTGRVALIGVPNMSGGSSTITNSGSVQITATTAQEPFWTGLVGGPYGGKARFARDSRFGMPAVHTQLVQDQYNTALWVRADDVDPDDPEQTYRQRPGEGTTDDKVDG